MTRLSLVDSKPPAIVLEAVAIVNQQDWGESAEIKVSNTRSFSFLLLFFYSVQQASSLITTKWLSITPNGERSSKI